MLSAKTSLHDTAQLQSEPTLLPPCGIKRQAENMRIWKSTNGEFWNRLKRGLDVSRNVSEPGKNDLGNNPSRFDPILCIHKLRGVPQIYIERAHSTKSLSRSRGCTPLNITWPPETNAGTALTP